MRSSTYECRLTETHGTHRLRLLGSPPDLVHGGPIVQGPHPYVEPRSRRCPTRHDLCLTIIACFRGDCKRKRKPPHEGSFTGEYPGVGTRREALGRAWNATTATAASGGSRELLLGPRPARRKRSEAAAGSRNPCRTRREKLPEMRQKNLQSSKKPLPGIPTGAKSLDSERLRTGRQ